MKLTFCGAAGIVTGSCYLLETNEYMLLIDCGMFQGNKTIKEFNYKDFPFDPKKISFVILTHAHIDHCGLLPKLVKQGFNGKIYSTAATAELAKFMLFDSAKIQEAEVEQKNKRNVRKGLPKVTPIYTDADVQKTISLFEPVHENILIGDNIKISFKNSGHVLGSSIVDLGLVENGKFIRIVFSGDLGSKDRPIVEDPEFIDNADYLILESTYGNRKRHDVNKQQRLEMLAGIINETLTKGGNLVIPAFAFERTQDIIHDILILIESGKVHLKDAKINIDSPLAINIISVFKKYANLYDEDARKLRDKFGNIFKHPSIRYINTIEESKKLNNESRQIIISSSGMCDNGRIKHHLKHNLWRPESTVLFVGYQADQTLGRIILDGAKSVKIHGEEVKISAKIYELSGYSGHADQLELKEWVSKMKNINKAIFITHGEEDARLALASILKEITQCNVILPKMGECFDLSQIKCLDELHQTRTIPVLYKNKLDSYNIYAQVSLKLAEFMHKQQNEEIRQKVLNSILNVLSQNLNCIN